MTGLVSAWAAWLFQQRTEADWFQLDPSDFFSDSVRFEQTLPATIVVEAFTLLFCDIRNLQLKYPASAFVRGLASFNSSPNGSWKLRYLVSEQVSSDIRERCFRAMLHLFFICPWRASGSRSDVASRYVIYVVV